MAVDKLTLSNFFHLYIFTPKSKKLSKKDQKIAVLGNILMGMTLGIGHGICGLLYLYDKKIGSHVAPTSDKTSDIAIPIIAAEAGDEAPNTLLSRADGNKASTTHQMPAPAQEKAPSIDRLKSLSAAQKEFYAKIDGNLEVLKEKCFNQHLHLEHDFLDPIVKEIGIQSKEPKEIFTRNQQPFNQEVYNFLIAKKAIFAYSYDNNGNTRIQLTQDISRGEGKNNWVTAASIEQANREVKEFENKYDSVVDPSGGKDLKNRWRPFFLEQVFNLASRFVDSDQFSFIKTAESENFLDCLVTVHAIKAWSVEGNTIHILIGDKGEIKKPLGKQWITVEEVEAISRFKEAFNPLKLGKERTNLGLETRSLENRLIKEIRVHPNECFEMGHFNKEILKECIQRGIIDSYANPTQFTFVIKMKLTDLVPPERSDLTWIKKEDLEKS